MTLLDELEQQLNVFEINYEIIEERQATLETNFGNVRIDLKVEIVKDMSTLIDLIGGHLKIWVHSLERLPASHELMIRYAWVN